MWELWNLTFNVTKKCCNNKGMGNQDIRLRRTFPHHPKMGTQPHWRASIRIKNESILFCIMFFFFFFRLEFPDGLSVSVPQLACVCVGVCVSVGRGHRCSQRHAREPALLLRGQPMSLLTTHVYKYVLHFTNKCVITACLFNLFWSERQARRGLDDFEASPWHKHES